MFAQWLLHTVSAFSSEPASRFAATLVLKAFCGIFYWFTFPRFSVFLLHKSVFTLAEHLICSLSAACPALPCPGSFRPGWPLSIFWEEHFISTFFFFFAPNDTTTASDSSFDPKSHIRCVLQEAFLSYNGYALYAPDEAVSSDGSVKSLLSCTKNCVKR